VCAISISISGGSRSVRDLVMILTLQLISLMGLYCVMTWASDFFRDKTNRG
jgi:hypothetical protein